MPWTWWSVREPGGERKALLGRVTSRSDAIRSLGEMMCLITSLHGNDGAYAGHLLQMYCQLFAHVRFGLVLTVPPEIFPDDYSLAGKVA